MLIHKPRLLIPLTVQFSVRYVVRTGLLKRICQYAQPVIALGWEDADLQKELIELGAEVVRLPAKQIGGEYRRLSLALIQWHLRKINTPTTQIDRRREKLLAQWNGWLRMRIYLKDDLFRFVTHFAPIVRYLRDRQEKLIWSDTNLNEYVALVQQVRPDVCFCLTPYFLEEEFLLRAVQSAHVPIATAILSFDNLTTRGYFPIGFEEYFLWNQYNALELQRIYPEANGRPVILVGAPQFDFYQDPTYLWSDSAWRSELGLPAGRPVILFGSASRAIAPQEEQWLAHLDQAIENGGIIERPVVVLRRHPNERMERWDGLKKSSHNLYFDEPWKPGQTTSGKTDVTRRDIEKLASTLYHSAVHINASSTMTVDGAIFDRPQIGPAYDETGKFHRAAYEIYLREHYLPITRSGGLEIARSRSELIAAVNSAFTDPGRLTAGRRKLVQEICTYADGRCTDRVNDALRSFVERKTGAR